MNSDFEKQLQRQPLRQIPADWRSEILQAAKAAQSFASQPSTLNSQPRWAAWLRGLFWPCPQAWAGLAAVWVVLLAVNYSSAESHPAQVAKAPSADWVASWNEQKRLLAELTSRGEPAREADRPKTSKPGPRTEWRREQFIVV